MRMKSLLASLALAGLALPAFYAPGRPETVTLTTPDGPPPSASPAPDQEYRQDASAAIEMAQGATDAPLALPTPSPAVEGRAGAVPDPSASVAQDGSADAAAVAADPPQSSLKRFLSAIVQFAASAASPR